MKEVIRIEGIDKETEKPVEFTHYLNSCEGWKMTYNTPRLFNKVVYLGRCPSEGDMFACYYNKVIEICKGHLNSGKY